MIDQLSLLINPLWALLGVLLGARLSRKWDQRNWHLQELLKAYAAMLPAGIRELKFCESLHFAGLEGDDLLIDLAIQKIPSFIESPFVEQLAKCRLLEKNAENQRRIDDIEAAYKKCRISAKSVADQWRWEQRLQDLPEGSERRQLEKRIQRAEEREKDAPDPSDVLKVLIEFREKVSGDYFRK